jgi:putative oxidoreductase
MLIYCAISSHTYAPRFDIAVPELLGAAAGALIIAGFWTPVTGIILSADAMIGPGAWSIDARLFGRKQIITDI